MKIYFLTVRVKCAINFLMSDTIEKIGITRRHLNYLLRGHCNATAKTARSFEQITGIPKEIWVFGSAEERQAAWKEFINKKQKHIVSSTFGRGDKKRERKKRGGK